MLTFLSILAVLLVINVLLLVFSVNGAMGNFKKRFRRISENTVIKLPPSARYSEPKYKKAV